MVSFYKKVCIFASCMNYVTQTVHHYKEILTIGIPIVIGQLGTIVLGFADTLMIGHHSTQELAAAGLVNNIFSLALLFYLGFSYGLTPIVGRLFGMERKDEIGQKVKNSLVANMLIGVLLTIVMTVLYFNLGHIGQPEELLPLIRPYFLVNLVSILFVGIFNTLKQFFDGIANPRIPMWMMVLGNCVNILFNWFLIYGVCGFPELGLLGAGISTLGSRILMAVLLVVILFFRKKYRLYRESVISGSITKQDLYEMNRLGWPVAIQLGIETAAFSLSCIMVGWMGTVPLAAHQVMIIVSQLFYLIISGLASAMSIRVSHFVGQNDIAAVRTCAYDGFRLILLFSCMMSIPALLFRHDVGGLFSDSIEVQQVVAQLILILVIYQFGDGLQFTFANALRGISCVKPMMYIAIFAYLVICLPLGYLLGFIFHLGISGVWAAFPFGLTIAGVLYWTRFLRELKKKDSLFFGSSK